MVHYVICLCTYTSIRFCHYRVIALISVNIVPSWDIERRELVSVRRYPNEGQISVNIVPSWDIEGLELASVRRYHNEGQYSPVSVR